MGDAAQGHHHLAEKGNCVIVGRCADHVLAGRDDTLHVFIHADMKARAERIVRLYGMTEKSPEKRLEEKDAVYYEEGGKAKQYYAKLPQNEVVIEETKHFLDKTFKGRLGLMMNAMIREEAITKEEIDELYQILENSKVGE